MTSDAAHIPLAYRLRPQTAADYIGQQHLLAAGKPLAKALQQGLLHSMILWGPPGTGKTTLAMLLAGAANAHVEKISAVLAGVKDIRAVIERAELRQQQEGQHTVLFVDEVHRFNKAQQDAFLPHVEKGTVTFIGATTENPSFQLNNALLSRARVYLLKPLQVADLEQIVQKGVAYLGLDLPEPLQKRLATYADGDARQVLNVLEMIADFATEGEVIDEALLSDVLAHSNRRFDHHGDLFYDQISALHKSVRGSDPDAALYWFSRMLDGGCDPHYIARRLLRMASEDIGNADPRALTIALEAWQTYERLGSPEGELALAQAIVFLAVAAKSNATYTAANLAMQAAKQYGSLDVPLHLRNAPTALMKEIGCGKDYRYAHDEAGAFAAGECYFPEGMPEMHYYQPVDRGLEAKINEKLTMLRRKNRKQKV